MKKISALLLIILVSSFVARAQMPKRNHFAIQIMYDQSKEKNRLGSDASFRQAEKQKGTSVGFLYEFDFKKWRSVDIGFETGLTYLYHRAKTSDTRINGAFQSNYTVVHKRHDIALPLRLVYRQLIARDTYLTFYFGPQFVFSASNKAVETEKRLSAQGQQEYNTTYNLLKNGDGDKLLRSYVKDDVENQAPVYSNVKPFNVQLGLGGSFQFHQIQIRAGYEWGLTNLFTNTYTATSLKSWQLTNRVDQWYVGLVLFLPEKKAQW
ncbi:MAG TPA: hypothetical protein DEO38_03690 [Bacteroidales bacterium]|nr:hypothetical protein [Bacteroidales bacterium]